MAMCQIPFISIQATVFLYILLGTSELSAFQSSLTFSHSNTTYPGVQGSSVSMICSWSVDAEESGHTLTLYRGAIDDGAAILEYSIGKVDQTAVVQDVAWNSAQMTADPVDATSTQVVLTISNLDCDAIADYICSIKYSENGIKQDDVAQMESLSVMVEPSQPTVSFITLSDSNTFVPENAEVIASCSAVTGNQGKGWLHWRIYRGDVAEDIDDNQSDSRVAVTTSLNALNTCAESVTSTLTLVLTRTDQNLVVTCFVVNDDFYPESSLPTSCNEDGGWLCDQTQTLLVLYVSEATCVGKSVAAAAVGDVVKFTFCVNDLTHIQYLHVDTKMGSFELEVGRWTNHWFLYPDLSQGIYIEVYIASEDYIAPAWVETSPISVYYLDIFHAASPQLCASETGSPYIVTADFRADASSTVCILSLDESGTFETSADRVSENIDPGSHSTFTVSDQPGTEGFFERELVLEVADMSVADVGNWTVDVTNGVGTFTVEVYIQATGPPKLCQGETNTHESFENVGESFTQTICVLIPGGQPPTINLTKSNFTGQDYGLAVGAESLGNGISYDVTLRSGSVLEGDFGLWFVDIVSVDGKTTYMLSFNVTLLQGEAPTPPTTSVNWLAMGLGLTSLVIIIVVVVAVVLITRRNKNVKRPPKITGSIQNNYTVTGRDTTSTYQNILLNSIGPTQQPSGTSDYATINDADVEPIQSRSGPVVATPIGEYVLPDSGDLTSQARSDHAEATPGEYVTMDSELPASNRSDHNIPTTSRYETVSADFPFTQAIRTISGGTSDGGQPGMTSGPYDLCNSADIEPPNVYQRMDNGSYVNHAIGRESGGARETYNNVASAYEDDA